VVNDKFWEVVKDFNILMRSAIQGPNCLIVCNGDCCSIKINIARVLAEEDSGIKPPQCWIYPTNFSNPEYKEISCKKAHGWRILDPKKAKEAEKLLKYYTFLCQLEAKKELNLMNSRINHTLTKNHLKDLLKHTSPSELAGFKDNWNKFSTLSAQGVSLQMKKFCKKFNHKCGIEYLSCNSICDKVIEGLLEFLQQNIFKYVQKYGPDHEGEYTFIMLQR